MKQILICLLILLLAAGWAAAEGGDDYWTSNDDLYYHVNASCGAGEGRVPISARAGTAFGKDLCPICASREDDAQPPAAVARGGTIVVKFSDAWVNAHELTGVFGFSGESGYSGVQALRQLAAYLHGDAYNAFLTSWLQNGKAEGRANAPYILPVNGTLVLHRRHIGENWYIILRPQEKFSGAWNMYWRVSSYHLRAEGETLYSEFDQQTVEETYKLDVQALNGSEPVYRREGETAIEVYQALEGNIAVIREENPCAQIESVQLRIGGRSDGIELSGYVDGTSAVYCCILTDAELEALRANARAELWHTEAVNGDIYRVDGAQAYSYYSLSSDECLFTIDKAGGLDPVDDDFRLILDGEPDCFVVDDNIGEPAIYRYLQSGRELVTVQGGAGHQLKRVTPLFWYGDGGAFLAEAHKYEDYAVDDRLFENGIEYDVRFGSAPEDEWGSYLCWLVDEKGEVIGSDRNQAFTVHENGTVSFETIEGDSWICDPRKEAADD